MDEITTQKWMLDSEGMLEIPQKPGLGIELNKDALQSMTTADVQRIFG